MYGVSVVYPAAMISFAGLLNSLRNEALFRDSLTGLFNRSFMNDFSEEISKRGNEAAVTAMMMDINDFKRINDTYGHQEGDVALIKVAEILKTTVGALGCVIRYAGDEFVVLLNTRQQEIVDGCIQSIRRAFRVENESSGKPYELTMSIGACIVSEEKKTLDDILTEADRAMYVEKNQFYSDPRRNRRSN